MDAWAAIRRRACACRREAALAGAATAPALLGAAYDAVGLEIRGFVPGEPGFPLGLRGRLERESMLVYASATLTDGERAEVLAHELGHFHLHDDPVLEDRVETEVSAHRGHRLLGYSPREAKERQADAFAAEFLCRSQDVRDAVLGRGESASAVAAARGVSLDLVLRQATAALLRPPGDAPAPGRAPEPELDGDLARLAAWDGAALLVSGWGDTGKTSVLRGRVRHLAAAGARPAHLLVLVGSEDAAEAFRESMAVELPAFASEAWVGTPRGLAVEIVSRWAEAIPRRPDFRILAAGEARRLLHACLDHVRAHRGLPGATGRDLTLATRAIALAKATLRAPGETGVDPDLASAYEDALREANALDAGDLVPKAARILGENPAILASVHARFRHVLVDDGQDLTPAASRLVDLVARPDGTLWAVRDTTSAIQLFRGADPGAIAALVSKRGGRTETLTSIRASWGAAFGAQLRFRQWLERPGSRSWPIRGVTIPLSVARDEEDEARAVAEQIEAMRRDGLAYREQVVLGRSNATVNRIASGLDRAGIPLLHLGDMRERDDVRALLGLLQIAVHGTAASLRDVVAIPRYGMSSERVEAVLLWCETRHGGALPPVLAAPDQMPGIDDPTREILATMREDLAGFRPGSSPFEVLATWLFERCARAPARVPGRLGLKERLSQVATHHVLMACREAEADGEGSPRGVAGRIDRIASLDQETHFRRTDLSRIDADAVAVMTIHAACGRRFRGAHIVGCSARAASRADDAAEAAAFMAALSRATERLHLSRPERRNGRSVAPSRFLDGVAGLLNVRAPGFSRAL